MEVLQAKPKADHEVALTPPGTVTVLIARKGSGDLGAFREAVTKGGKQAEQLLQGLIKQSKGQKPLTRKGLADGLLTAPVYADIRYGGSVINSGQFVPAKGQKVVGNIFPYNGGRLAREGFELVEHYQPGSTAALEGIVLRSDPPLTAAEKAALKMVPSEQLIGNVGSRAMSWCDTTWAAVAGVVLFAAAATVQFVCTAILVDKGDDFSQRDLNRLTPAASAKQILQLRRQIYEKALQSKGM